MNYEKVLNLARRLLLERKSLGISPSNCNVVAAPVLYPQNSTKWIQIHFGGVGVSLGAGDANLGSRISFSVRIYHRVLSDDLGNFKAASNKAMEDVARVISALHGAYDVVEVPLEGPILCDGVSPIRTATESSSGRVFYVDVNFRVEIAETLEYLRSQS
jgi:hypothetical protein